MMDNDIVHILLVEDDENHAELVRRAFEPRSEEMNLTVLGTLKDARVCIEEIVPDLLIVDLRLSDGGGLELLPDSKEKVQFPVMVMTSHGDEQIAVEAMKAGALDYVVKTKDTLADMAHIADRALREWKAITHRREAENLQNLQKNVLEKIVAGDSTIDILNALCTHVESMVSQSVCSMMVLEESTNSLRVLAAPHAPENLCAALNGLKPGERAGSCGTAAYTGKAVFVFDIETDPRWTGLRDVARQLGIRGCWSVPIVSEKKKTLGTFAISHPNPRAPTPFHRQLLEMASYMAGITIQRREAEDRLRASEDQFRDLYDTAPLAYFSVDPDGRILMANSKAIELLGYAKEELLGRSVLEIYAPTKCGVSKARVLQEQSLEGKEIVGQELEMQKADGSRFWVSLTVRLIFDVNGTLIERRGMVEDISLRKRAETTLAQQKTILEMIALGQSLPDILTRLCEIIEAQLPGLVCSILLLEGTVLRKGAAPGLPETYLRKIEGIEIGPCAGSCGTAAFRKEPVIVSDIATDPLWERGRRLAMGHGLRACWSTPILSSDGSVLGTFAMYYQEPRTPNSEDLKVIATSTSLAGIAIEHRKAQESVQKSEERYRCLYDDNPTMYFTVSPEGMVLSVNQFGAEQLGYTVDDLVGQPVFNLVHDEDRSYVQKEVNQCLDNHESLAHWEFRKVRKDRTLLWVKETARVVESADGHPVLLMVSEDISARKQAEDILRAIVEGTAAVTSADFFRSLLRHLSSALQIPYAFLAECVDSRNTRVRTLEFLNRDSFIDNIEYDLHGTPCEQVIAGKICYHPEEVQQLFPQDQDLVDLGVQCYLGIPLHDSADKVIGHLVIMGDQSVTFDTQTESLLKIFAARAGAELERGRAEQALQENNERLRALNVQLSAAEEAGRKRMARELHDQFGQTLTLLKFELSELADCVLKSGLGPSSVSFASDRLQSINSLVGSTIQSVRNTSSFLRPPILDDFGLIPALEWLGEDLHERTHLQCSITIDPQLIDISLNEAQTTTLFRIAQELLTNVIRHANASEVKLELKMESNVFILDVRDNGQGIGEESLSGANSFGLRGIRERAWLLGGDFTLQGQPGTGTTATVRIPHNS